MCNQRNRTISKRHKAGRWDGEEMAVMGFPPGWCCGKDSTCQRDVGSTPELERTAGGGNGNPLQYSCLGNPRAEEPGRISSMRLQKSQTRVSDWTRTTNGYYTSVICKGLPKELKFELRLKLWEVVGLIEIWGIRDKPLTANSFRRPTQRLTEGILIRSTRIFYSPQRQKDSIFYCSLQTQLSSASWLPCSDTTEACYYFKGVCLVTQMWELKFFKYTRVAYNKN